jgi:hypothetical protein
MSLLKFLTAGRSFVGGNGDGSRYRLPCRRALPKFAAKPNPFRATSVPETARATEHTEASHGFFPFAAEEQQPELAPIQPQAAEPAAVTETESPAAVGSAANVAAPSAPTPAAEAQPVSRIATRMARLMEWWRSGGRSARPAIPRFGRPAVQGELRLESVRVVRNDLSDSDLEVVKAKPAAKRAGATASGSAAAPAMEGRWSRVSARFFGAGGT